MTESEEKELVIVKTAIQTAYADKLERDLAIGAGLLQIFRRKLYRGKEGGRNWRQWLAEESSELTGGRGALNEDTSQRLRAFYQFRCEVLQPSATWRAGSPLPASPAQVRPLIGQLDTHPEAAIEMWKAAVADAKGNGGNKSAPGPEGRVRSVGQARDLGVVPLDAADDAGLTFGIRIGRRGIPLLPLGVLVHPLGVVAGHPR